MATRAAGISPRRLFVIMVPLVLAIGAGLAIVRGGSVWALTVAGQGALEAVFIGLIAGPFAAMVHLLNGSDRQAALRAVTVWGVVVTALLLLMAGTGNGLIDRFGEFVPAG